MLDLKLVYCIDGSEKECPPARVVLVRWEDLSQGNVSGLNSYWLMCTYLFIIYDCNLLLLP